MSEVLDPFLGTVGAVDVHTRISVSNRALRGVVGHESQSVSDQWGMRQASLTG